MSNKTTKTTTATAATTTTTTTGPVQSKQSRRRTFSAGPKSSLADWPKFTAGRSERALRSAPKQRRTQKKSTAVRAQNNSAEGTPGRAGARGAQPAAPLLMCAPGGQAHGLWRVTRGARPHAQRAPGRAGLDCRRRRWAGHVTSRVDSAEFTSGAPAEAGQLQSRAGSATSPRRSRTPNNALNLAPLERSRSMARPKNYHFLQPAPAGRRGDAANGRPRKLAAWLAFESNEAATKTLLSRIPAGPVKSPDSRSHKWPQGWTEAVVAAILFVSAAAATAKARFRSPARRPGSAPKSSVERRADGRPGAPIPRQPPKVKPNLVPSSTQCLIFL